MPLAVVLTHDAIVDLRQAKSWYDDQRAGLSDALRDEVNAAFAEIVEHPVRWPVVVGPVRRYRLDRFPFSIPYLVEDDRIVVLGILHGARDPRILQGRLRRRGE